MFLIDKLQVLDILFKICKCSLIIIVIEKGPEAGQKKTIFLIGFI